MTGYQDLRDWLNTLTKNDKLAVVDRPINKNTELAPLVRLQYRGLPEEKRKGFLFNNVRGEGGIKYDMHVATGIYASSREMYALSLDCEPTIESIDKRWVEAQLHPLEPRLVESGPAQEVVITREEMEKTGKGLNILPVPVEIPGFSGNIRTSVPFMTKDPKSGWVNVGTYSAHMVGKTKMQWEIERHNHGWAHYTTAKEIGKDLDCAVVIGGPPVLFYVGSAKLPFGVNELTIAGGLVEAPLDVVKCKTVNLEVPATSEVIIEGKVSLGPLEAGNSYGEYNGYMAHDVRMRPVVNVTAITFRKDPIFVHVMSQMPPSESSKVRTVSSDNIYYKFLKYDCKVPGILDVAWHEISQASWCVIRMKKINNTHPWQALHLAAGYDAWWGKFFIAVDDDIDARDVESVIWALSWRVQPKRDTEVIGGRFAGLDPSAYKPDASHEEKLMPNVTGASAILIDATRKWPYTPVSLPRKEYMENALKIWRELKFPELSLRQPWYGYELGFWPQESREDADFVVKGDFESVGKRLAARTVNKP